MLTSKKRSRIAYRTMTNGIEHNPNDPLDYARQWFYHHLNRYNVSGDPNEDVVVVRAGALPMNVEQTSMVAWNFIDEYLPLMLAPYIRGDGGEARPIPMRIHCPTCGTLHIDEGEYAAKPHHTHACQECGMTWRPAIVPTVGVRFLPGFKNAAPASPQDELSSSGKNAETGQGKPPPAGA